MPRALFRIAFFTLGIVSVCVLAQPTPNPSRWSKSWSYHPSAPGWPEHRMSFNSVSREGDELYGDLMFANTIAENKVPPAVIIRGVQLADGGFWPYMSLDVGSDFKGPWKPIGSSHREGKKMSLTVPASITVAGLRADFRPFRPYLDSMAWGRVVLPTGDVAVIRLEELRGPE